MTYSLSNNCTKNYYNRTLIVQVIVEDVVTWIFLRHLYVCAKFEARISIRSKFIRGPKISKFGHVTQATTTLWSWRSRGPSSMSVPNLKQISLFVPKL